MPRSLTLIAHWEPKAYEFKTAVSHISRKTSEMWGTHRSVVGTGSYLTPLRCQIGLTGNNYCGGGAGGFVGGGGFCDGGRFCSSCGVSLGCAGITGSGGICSVCCSCCC